MPAEPQDYLSFDPEWKRERNLEAFGGERPIDNDDIEALVKLRLLAQYAPQLLTEGETL